MLSSTNGDQVGLCQGSNNPHFNVITLLTIYLAAIYSQGEEQSYCAHSNDFKKPLSILYLIHTKP